MENSLDNLLDIGCGRGHFLENLRINGLNYLGIDNSLEQIKVCKDKSLNAENLELKEIDQIFDCAVAILMLVNFCRKTKSRKVFLKISILF